MTGLPWWLWVVAFYCLTVGIQTLSDRWVSLWRLWALPLVVLGLKSICFVHSPWLMILGSAFGGVLGSIYAQGVVLEWSKQRPWSILIPGGKTTFTVMFVFVLFKISLGGLFALGVLDAMTWQPLDWGGVAIFTGYNVSKVVNWTWRLWRWRRSADF